MIEANVVDVERTLEQMEAHAGDLTGVWPEVGRWWQARQLTVFATANRGAWPMRSPNTKPAGRGLLIRTGALRRSVSGPQPLYASPSTARFGQRRSVGAFYGRFHQFGESQPLREVVPGLTGQEAKEVTDIIAEFIMDAS